MLKLWIELAENSAMTPGEKAKYSGTSIYPYH